MENFKLVLPEHLNHFGYLFGGNLLKWVDEVAWIAASLDFPECKFVTIAMDKVEFRKSIKEGTILRFLAEKVRIGNTSIKYTVNVFDEGIKTGDEEKVFTTNVTLVCLDEAGNKANIPER
ncbi:MAG: acyl-CoA thioesterase [Nitrospirae bacterium]|nr:acyl-CoA thioesterase [Nitrospirota bacterium]